MTATTITPTTQDASVQIGATVAWQDDGQSWLGGIVESVSGAGAVFARDRFGALHMVPSTYVITEEIQVGDRVRLARAHLSAREGVVTAIRRTDDGPLYRIADIDSDGTSTGHFTWRLDKVDDQPVTPAEPVAEVSPDVRAQHEQAVAALQRQIEEEKANLARFQDQVRSATMAMKRERDWCGEAERALGDLGIKATKKYRVTGTLQFTATVEAPDDDFWNDDQIELDTYSSGLTSFLRSCSDSVEVESQGIEYIEDVEITVVDD